MVAGTARQRHLLPTHIPYEADARYTACMMNIVFLEVDPQDEASIHERFPDARVFLGTLQDEEMKQLKDAEVLSIFIYSNIGREELKALPKLRLLCTRSVGFHHIDMEACKERGITVCNVPDYGSHVIAEHVFALLLATLRHVHEGDKRVEGGVFDYHGLRGMALGGKTLGIVGTGKIGRRVAEIAHGFGMKILAVDQCRTLELVDLLGVQYVSFDELLHQSDIITLHIPHTKETEHMVDAHAIAKMKDGVILINTARGEIIDSAALLAALRSGKVAHALLDVLEHEKDFEWNKDLISHPRVVTTPHIAFYADDSMKSMYIDSFQSIEQWQHGGVPLHIVQSSTIICDVPPIRR